ncbi:hypothetical protein AB5J62_37360 [Amycolatopsis sp. cg5]|uniref:hypothetical protein n=1 Tax=Amycolatopsis sp. cg5 TaxID=3238802 RepID=UPI0035255ECB
MTDQPSDPYAAVSAWTTTSSSVRRAPGVTKSRFFRHFTGKCELLVAGQEILSRLLTEVPEGVAHSTRSSPVASARRRRWTR